VESRRFWIIEAAGLATVVLTACGAILLALG